MCLFACLCVSVCLFVLVSLFCLLSVCGLFSFAYTFVCLPIPSYVCFGSSLRAFRLAWLVGAPATYLELRVVLNKIDMGSAPRRAKKQNETKR